MVDYLISIDRCSKLFEREGAPNGYSLGGVTSPQETVGISAKSYDHYDVIKVPFRN
jgi:hypothetical protein